MRREGHKALRFVNGKLETFDAHPSMGNYLKVSVQTKGVFAYAATQLTDKDLELPLEVFVERYLRPAWEQALREAARVNEELTTK